MIRCQLCNHEAVFSFVCRCSSPAHYVCPDCESRGLEHGRATGHCLVCCEGDC